MSQLKNGIPFSEFQDGVELGGGQHMQQRGDQYQKVM